MNVIMLIRLAIVLGAAVVMTVPAQDPARGEKGLAPAAAACAAIEVPAGQTLAFHAYATGVQVYRWNGTSWDFVAPVASLFVDPNFQRQVGTHFAGPTWMTNGGGSTVVAAKVDGCGPDPTAVPWLLLRTTASEGAGLFGGTTYIQRVNTSGGLAPSTAGASVGAEARVPYTAEYLFYRAAF